MNQLIPLVNRLQDAFGAAGHTFINLPQITVVGSQSSGKSSVLESLVGRDFLPRGVGIVTRRPLILQLFNIPHRPSQNPKLESDANASKTQEDTPFSGSGNREQLPLSPDSGAVGGGGGSNINNSNSNSNSSNAGSSLGGKEIVLDEYGEFLHMPGQKFYDFDDIRFEIIRETERLTGKNKGVSNKSINLRIFSPHVLNLTLVDLPGITKVPTGDQPEDIEEQLRNMCLQFISNPNCIILAVSAANHDLANSDGIKLARQVDPKGERTVGIITKVDIMDHGTDCVDILSNKVIPLKRGYIAVINRSQKDIDKNLPIRSGLSNEQDYFRRNSKYHNLLDRCGTEVLSSTLNRMLISHIQYCLPEMKTKILSSLQIYRTLLRDLGETMDESGYKQLFLKLISDFSKNLSSATDGGNTSTHNLISTDSPELFGGARISYIFGDIFAKTLSSSSGTDGISDNTIRIAIANTYGVNPFLFIPEKAFLELVKRPIKRLEIAGLDCVDLVFDELTRLSERSITGEYKRFPYLRERVLEESKALLSECLAPTRKMISDLIAVEKSYVNIAHPDFIGATKSYSQAQARLRQQQQLQQQQQHQQQQQQPDPNQNRRTTNPFDENLGNNKANSPSNLNWECTACTFVNLPNNAKCQMCDKIRAAESGGNSRSPASNNSNNPNTNNSNNNSSSNNNSNNNNNSTNNSKGKEAKDTRSDNQGQNQKQSSGFPSGGGKGGSSIATAPSSFSDLLGRSNSSSSSSSNLSSSSKEVQLPYVPEHITFLPTATEKEKLEIDIVKTLIDSYFLIVKKTFIDLVPKIITNFLVGAFKNDLNSKLVSQLYSQHLSSDLMKESEDTAEKRRNCEAMLDILNKSLTIMNEARDFAMIASSPSSSSSSSSISSNGNIHRGRDSI